MGRYVAVGVGVALLLIAVCTATGIIPLPPVTPGAVHGSHVH